MSVGVVVSPYMDRLRESQSRMFREFADASNEIQQPAVQFSDEMLKVAPQLDDRL